MRTAYDSIASLSGNIPIDAQIVCGYVLPSRHAWSSGNWARFRTDVRVRIDTSGTAYGAGIQVIDVEAGAASPAEAVDWCAWQRRQGQDPTVYCSAGSWDTLIDEFEGRGVPQPHYWIAAYPGTGANLPTHRGITAVAHQYSAQPGYDLSVVQDYWPGVDREPDVTQPTAQQIADQVIFNTPLIDPTGRAVENANVNWYWTNRYVNLIPGLVSAVAEINARLAAMVSGAAPATIVSPHAVPQVAVMPPPQVAPAVAVAAPGIQYRHGVAALLGGGIPAGAATVLMASGVHLSPGIVGAACALLAAIGAALTPPPPGVSA